MSVVFKPSGTLNVSAPATDLPVVQVGLNGVSEASVDMTRCKNLQLDRPGYAVTRPGSTRVSSRQTTEKAKLLMDLAGTRYEFTSAAIYQDESPIKTGYSATNWSGIKSAAATETTQQIFATDATNRIRIQSGVVYNWGIAAPTAAPTVAAGASTGLTGTYYAKYTYVRKSGTTVVCESNPSPASASQALSNQSFSVTWTASSDAQVTHVRVYRTLAGGTVYYVDQDVAIGTVTVDSTTADTALGALAQENHNAPPLLEVVAGPHYNGRVFGSVGNLLYWSSAREVEYWPAANFVEVSDPSQPIVALADYSGQVYAITKREIFYIQGTTSGNYAPVPMRALTGCDGRFLALGVEGHGLFRVAADGIYLYRGGVDRKITQDNLDPVFRTNGEANGIAGVQNASDRWLIQYENKLYFHYGNGSAIVLNLDNARVSSYKWDAAIVSATWDKANDRLIGCDAFRYTRILENRSATDDVGTAIAWEVESKDFTLQTRAHFPRWAKYDVDATNTVTGSILLDGTVHQTHSITTKRDVKRRLIQTGNGNRCSIRLAGTGQASIYAAEME